MPWAQTDALGYFLLQSSMRHGVFLSDHVPSSRLRAQAREIIQGYLDAYILHTCTCLHACGLLCFDSSCLLFGPLGISRCRPGGPQSIARGITGTKKAPHPQAFTLNYQPSWPKIWGSPRPHEHCFGGHSQ